jgi:hypothetical protein
MRQLGTASIGLALSIILVCALVNSTEKGRLPRGPSSPVSPSVSSSLANSAELNHGYLNVSGPADAGLNNLEGSASATESKLQFLYPVQQDCCDCDPTASDAQCFAQCNAMLPRCRPPAPRGAEPALRPGPRDRALQKRSDRILLRGQPEVLQRSLPRTDLPWRALLSDCEELDSVAARARSRLLVATPVATMRGDR